MTTEIERVKVQLQHYRISLAQDEVEGARHGLVPPVEITTRIANKKLKVDELATRLDYLMHLEEQGGQATEGTPVPDFYKGDMTKAFYRAALAQQYQNLARAEWLIAQSGPLGATLRMHNEKALIETEIERLRGVTGES